MAEWLDRWRAFAQQVNPALKPGEMKKRRIPGETPGVLDVARAALVATPTAAAELIPGVETARNLRESTVRGFTPLAPSATTVSSNSKTASVQTPTPEPPGFVFDRTVSPVDNQFPQRPEIAAATNRPVDTVYTPTGPVTRGSSEPPKPMEVVNYRTPQGTASGARVAGRGQGGFVGAPTDAEAARNLQARFAQDEAAKQIATNTDRAVERMRDFRADRMGISRGRLDASEGRGGGGEEAIRGVTQNPFAMPGDSFGDDVMRKNKLLSAIENPEGKKRRDRFANQTAAVNTFKAFMEGGQQPTQTTPGVNPLDAGRFLLDQEKFARQQGLDKVRLGIEQGTLEDRRAGTALEQQKYSDEQRAAFVENFSFPDENAPREQIAADVFNMSQATGGLVPPEVVSAYYAKVAKELGIDWGKGGPKNPMDLNEEVMKAIARDYGGK